MHAVASVGFPVASLPVFGAGVEANHAWQSSFQIFNYLYADMIVFLLTSFAESRRLGMRLYFS